MKDHGVAPGWMRASCPSWGAGWIILAAVILWRPAPSFADYKPELEGTYVAILVSEAGNQGFGGMLGVAEVLRNRKWKLAGFCGLRRKGLHHFVSRQPRRVLRDARRAIEKARHGSDTVMGARHFENVKAFGKPRWARSMKQVAVVKDHIFFKD